MSQGLHVDFPDKKTIFGFEIAYMRVFKSQELVLEYENTLGMIIESAHIDFAKKKYA